MASNAKPNVRHPRHPLHFMDYGTHPPCAYKHVNTFFPGPGQMRQLAEARATCEGCPIRNQCFDYAIKVNVDGVWAATTQRERAAYRMTHGIIAHDMSMEPYLPPVYAEDPHCGRVLITERTMKRRGLTYA